MQSERLALKSTANVADLKKRIIAINSGTYLKNEPTKKNEASAKKYKPILFILGSAVLMSMVFGSRLNQPLFVAIVQILQIFGPVLLFYVGFKYLEAKGMFEIHTVSQGALRKLTAELKERVITNFPTVEKYSAVARFPKQIYDSCLLFPDQRYDKSSALDDIVGDYHGVKYRVLKLSTTVEKVSRDKYGHKEREDEPVFQGLLVAAEFNKKFNGITAVSTDTTEDVMGRWAKRLQRLSTINSDLKLVDLEDPNFESQFMVRSTDPIEARYILSSNFMKQILRLQENFDYNIQLLFKDGTMMISIPTGHDILGTVSSVRDIDWAVKHLNKGMSDILEIFDELELDKSLWAKASGY